MQIELLIPGEPIAQPRVKAAAFNGHVKMYTPTKNGIADYKAAIRLAASQAYHGAPLDCPVTVDCLFVFSRPKSHFGTGKNAGKLKANAPHAHTTKPDRDNCDKAVLDALKGVALSDDCRVWRGSIEKRYTFDGEQPHALIQVSW